MAYAVDESESSLMICLVPLSRYGFGVRCDDLPELYMLDYGDDLIISE